MKELTEKRRKFAEYKWEFLRRNPKYIDEWEELQEQIEQSYGAQRPPTGEPTEEEIDFCMKWEILNPLSPHNSLHEMVKSFGEVSKHEPLERRGSIELEKMQFYNLIDPLWMLRKLPVSFIGGWEYEYDDDTDTVHAFISDKLSKAGLLELEIDLNYSKKRLMDELKSVIDEWKEIYETDYKRKLFAEFHKLKETQNRLPRVEKFKDFDVDLNEGLIPDMDSKEDFEKFYKQKVKERQKQYRTKYHFDNFNIYLQVWDLREEEKLSWREIATKLFPRDPNGVQTARNHYRAACEIIEKGVEMYVK
jgi:hypothetical protein